MIQATDGNLYGTTSNFGPNCCGTIFKIDTSGSRFTTLHSFAGSDGANPFAGLIQGTDGILYGTTPQGGASNYGTIFQIDTGGTAFATLHGFTYSDGANPSGLVQGTDGSLYGTTSTGGSAGGGVVFKFVFCSLSQPPVITLNGPPTFCAGGSVTLDAGAGYSSYFWFPGGQTTQTIVVTTSGSYTVTAADTNGCVGTSAPTVITVNPNPSPVITPGGPTTFCAGGSVTLDAGTGYASYLWSPGGQTTRTIVVTTSGSYTVTVTDANGCHGTSAPTVVTVNPSPAPIITVSHCPPPNTSGLGASVPANAGDTYNWTITGGTIESGQGTNAISFTSGSPGETMSLSVDETNPASCVGTAADTLQVDFSDVPSSDPFYAFVCVIGRDGITAGCGNGDYCADNPVTRAEMAVFVLKGKHGASYFPPPASGTVFADVPANAFAAAWIEQLYHEGITAGCGGGNYCPNDAVTRAQMAVFLLRAEHGSGYTPPTCAGIFQDVACTPTPAFAVDWIERLYAEGVTGGCSASPLLYCPGSPNTRGQMAVFLVKTFNLP